MHRRLFCVRVSSSVRFVLAQEFAYRVKVYQPNSCARAFLPNRDRFDFACVNQLVRLRSSNTETPLQVIESAVFDLLNLFRVHACMFEHAPARVSGLSEKQLSEVKPVRGVRTRADMPKHGQCCYAGVLCNRHHLPVLREQRP